MLRAYILLPLAFGLMTASAADPVGVADSLSDAACNFTVELLRKAVAKGENNLVISPVSIGAVLALLQQGAEGTTAKELEEVLHLTPEKSKEAFSIMATSLKNDERNVTLEWANGIFLREDFILNETYEQIVKENFRSIIEKRNFTNPSPEETANYINKWTSDVTHGEISDLVKPSMINVDTVMILINAIYFKGIWASKFNHFRSRVSEFRFTVEKSTQASYMRQEKRLPAGEDPTLGIKWVELPYQDDRFSMLFVLPNEVDGLQKVIETMQSEDLMRLISNTETRHVILGIPKFKLSWKSSLVQLMTKMGLSEIFTTKANLQGISQSNEALTVSELIHQANLEIDEDGTVASGVTGGFVQVLSLVSHEDELVFYAAHPFLAFIIDKENNIPIFAAKINDPTSGKHAEGPSPVPPSVGPSVSGNL